MYRTVLVDTQTKLIFTISCCVRPLHNLAMPPVREVSLHFSAFGAMKFLTISSLQAWKRFCVGTHEKPVVCASRPEHCGMSTAENWNMRVRVAFYSIGVLATAMSAPNAEAQYSMQTAIRIVCARLLTNEMFIFANSKQVKYYSENLNILIVSYTY